MGIHLHLPRLASCLFWPIAKSGLKCTAAAHRLHGKVQAASDEQSSRFSNPKFGMSKEVRK